MIRFEGKTVYIVGNNRLQNALLANYISEGMGVACRLVEGFGTLPELLHKEPESSLLLKDCLGLGNDKLMEILLDQRREITSRPPSALFNLHENLGAEAAALRCGVRGFFYENDPLEVFLKGIEVIFTGELWVSRRKMAAYIREMGLPSALAQKPQLVLTPRETEILNLLVHGASNEKIADQVCISAHTVKTHLYNIYRKIKVDNRLQAARWAANNF